MQSKEVEKLEVARKWELDDAEARALDLADQPGVQTLTVEFASSKGEVSVYVFKEADAKGDDGLLLANPQKALARARAKAGMIKADIPEKTPTRVIIRDAVSMTTVDVKLTNQHAPARDARIKKLEDENAALKKEVAEMKKQLDDIKKQSEKK